MQPAPQDFGSLFDADTRAAISSGLCIQCRGAKLLCGKARCPILVRWDSMMKTAPMIDRLDLGTLHTDQNRDRATSDTDLRAKEAVLDMYGRGLPVSKIQRAFSVGAFGIEKNRRFVPTRWSITAVDDTIGKDLRETAKTFPLVNEIRVFETIGFDDRFLVVMVPRPWRYELIEAWYPNTLWNPLGREVVMFGDHEGFEGRTTYASIGGCYYAARLAVGEALERERRQAATVIL